jgi:hypothetical protein
MPWQAAEKSRKPIRFRSQIRDRFLSSLGDHGFRAKRLHGRSVLHARTTPNAKPVTTMSGHERHPTAKI